MNGRLVAAIAVLAVGGSTAAAGTEATSPPNLAKQLASGVAKARTDGQRYTAILRVMKELRVPVFTAQGRQLVPGGSNLPKGFNVYDFLLRAAASSYSRKSSIEDFAALLSAGGKRVAPGQLRQALIAGVRAAAGKPMSSGSIVGLLLRELGLRQRPAYDLATNVPASRLTLDSLQTFLLVIDGAARPGTAAAYRVTERFGNPTSTPCRGETSSSPSPLGSGPPWSLGQTRGALLIAFWLRRAAIQLTALNTTPVWPAHYGPPGHTGIAGQERRLGVHAKVTEDLPDFARCGQAQDYLRSLRREFPPKGPYPDLRLDWLTTGEIAKHGTITADRRTNAEGNAFFSFKPKGERFPGFGAVKRRDGLVIARRDGQSIAQGWEVEFHKPRGFTFSGLSMTQTYKGPPGSDVTNVVTFTWRGRVCGVEDDSKWDFHQDVAQTAGASTSADFRYDFDIIERGLVVDTALGSERVQLLTNPPRIQIRHTARPIPPFTIDPDPVTGTATLAEDTNCPEGD
jgi:hypothetical protein